MSATESDRILAPGVPLTLATGRVVNLRYSMRSLKALEDKFGSVTAATLALNGIITRNGSGPDNPKIVGTLVPVLALGLAHEGITEDNLYDDGLLAWAEMRGVYFEAVAAAIDQAFPPPAKANLGKDGEPEATASSGEASTTQPPSSASSESSGT